MSAFKCHQNQRFWMTVNDSTALYTAQIFGAHRGSFVSSKNAAYGVHFQPL